MTHFLQDLADREYRLLLDEQSQRTRTQQVPRETPFWREEGSSPCLVRYREPQRTFHTGSPNEGDARSSALRFPVRFTPEQLPQSSSPLFTTEQLPQSSSRLFKTEQLRQSSSPRFTTEQLPQSYSELREAR